MLTDLIADINAANLAGGSDTITLAAQTRFTLSNGLNPSIANAMGGGCILNDGPK